MATMNVQQRGSKFQLRIRAPGLLPRDYFCTYDTYDEASQNGNAALRWLDSGLIPPGMADDKATRKGGQALTRLVEEYKQHNTAITKTDIALASLALPLVADLHTHSTDYNAVMQIVRFMKLEKMLAPSSIRKRIDFLGRVLAFHLAREKSNAANPFRMLPDGYSIYNDAEADILEARGDDVPRDEKRDRRLIGDEEARIRKAFAGEKMPGRERGFDPDPELTCMFDIMVDAGLRLRECYTLTRDAVQRTPEGAPYLHVRGTKGHRGAEKLRDVPLVARVAPIVGAWLEQLPKGETRLFPASWDGSRAEADLRATSIRLSQRFARVYAGAGVEDFKSHDLRHEAAIRFVLLRKPSGQWLLADRDLQSVMGWTSGAMADRYLKAYRGSAVVNVMLQLAA